MAVRARGRSASVRSRASRSTSASRAAPAAPAAPPRSASRSQKPAAAARAAAAAAAAAAPTTTHFEFMGPHLGPLGIVLGLPLLVWLSAFQLRGAGWTALPSLQLPAGGLRGAAAAAGAALASSVSARGFGLYLGWLAFQAALYLLVPGARVLGAPLRDGRRLAYTVNGWSCLLVTAAAAAAAAAAGWPLAALAEPQLFLELTTAAIVVSTALSLWLYAASFAPARMLAEGGNSGWPLYVFFIGRELNPRLLRGAFDLKYFCELRPGLFAWLLINAAAAAAQAAARGGLPDAAMLVVLALQAAYVADAVYCEEAILTTMDITMDGFGFMLAFGDLAWVPAMYSLQARFLAGAAPPPPPISAAYAAACAALGAAGFYIFRAANSQKDAFKRDRAAPELRGIATVPTAAGGALIAGGWWGASRHINYLGDWLLALAMSLPTAAHTPATYFYPLYFAVLLVHRERRDDHKCALKYGAAWEEYRRRVPWRIVPYVY